METRVAGEVREGRLSNSGGNGEPVWSVGSLSCGGLYRLVESMAIGVGDVGVELVWVGVAGGGRNGWRKGLAEWRCVGGGAVRWGL